MSATSGASPEKTAELESLGSQADYEAFLPAAQALEPGTLVECRADVAQACAHVKRGVENVLAQEARLGQLPDVNLEELRALPQLARGLAFAVLQLYRSLQGEARTPGGAPLLLREAAELRDRFWTLLRQRHEVLWRCGAWLHGSQVDAHVPPLQVLPPPPPVSESFPEARADLRRVRLSIRIGPDLSKRY